MKLRKGYTLIELMIVIAGLGGLGLIGGAVVLVIIALGGSFPADGSKREMTGYNIDDAFRREKEEGRDTKAIDWWEENGPTLDKIHTTAPNEDYFFIRMDIANENGIAQLSKEEAKEVATRLLKAIEG